MIAMPIVMLVVMPIVMQQWRHLKSQRQQFLEDLDVQHAIGAAGEGLPT